MSNSPVANKEGESSKATKVNLGICPECHQSFTTRRFAMQCAICQKNYHHQCLNKRMTASERNSDMLTGIKSIQGNIICATCENAAQTALAESKAIHEQMDKLQKKMRAQETATEQERQEAQQQIAILSQQAHQGQSAANQDKIMADFEELRATHDATKQQMGAKYRALLDKYKKDTDEAQTAINEKASLAASAISKYNHIEEVVTRLTAENCRLTQALQNDNHMELDHSNDNPLTIDEHERIYARFEELMNAQQKKINDMMLQTVAPLKQLIVETVDSR